MTLLRRMFTPLKSKSTAETSSPLFFVDSSKLNEFFGPSLVFSFRLAHRLPFTLVSFLLLELHPSWLSNKLSRQQCSTEFCELAEKLKQFLKQY